MLPHAIPHLNFGVHKDRILDTVDAKRVVVSGLLVAPKRPSTSSFTQYPDKGALAYDEATNTIMFSDGTAWHDLGAGGSGTVTSITATTPIVVTPSPITTTGVISLAPSGVTAGTYTNATITVNQFGLITAASSGSGGGGTVTSITATSPVVVTPSPITTTGVISLATVTSAGSYSLPNITVDSFGRVVAASSATLTAGTGITITPTGSPPTNYTIAATASATALQTFFWNTGVLTTDSFIGWNNVDDTTASGDATAIIMTRAGTIQNLYTALLNTNLTGTGTLTVTMFHNEAAVAGFSVTYTSPVTVPAVLSNTSSTFTVVAGDRISVQYTSTGSFVFSGQCLGASVELAS